LNQGTEDGALNNFREYMWNLCFPKEPLYVSNFRHIPPVRGRSVGRAFPHNPFGPKEDGWTQLDYAYAEKLENARNQILNVDLKELIKNNREDFRAFIENYMSVFPQQHALRDRGDGAGPSTRRARATSAGPSPASLIEGAGPSRGRAVPEPGMLSQPLNLGSLSGPRNEEPRNAVSTNLVALSASLRRQMVDGEPFTDQEPLRAYTKETGHDYLNTLVAYLNQNHNDFVLRFNQDDNAWFFYPMEERERAERLANDDLHPDPHILILQRLPAGQALDRGERGYTAEWFIEPTGILRLRFRLVNGDNVAQFRLIRPSLEFFDNSTLNIIVLKSQFHKRFWDENQRNDSFKGNDYFHATDDNSPFSLTQIRMNNASLGSTNNQFMFCQRNVGYSDLFISFAFLSTTGVYLVLRFLKREQIDLESIFNQKDEKQTSLSSCPTFETCNLFSKSREVAFSFNYETEMYKKTIWNKITKFCSVFFCTFFAGCLVLVVFKRPAHAVESPSAVSSSSKGFLEGAGERLPFAWDQENHQMVSRTSLKEKKEKQLKEEQKSVQGMARLRIIPRLGVEFNPAAFAFQNGTPPLQVSGRFHADFQGSRFLPFISGSILQPNRSFPPIQPFMELAWLLNLYDPEIKNLSLGNSPSKHPLSLSQINQGIKYYKQIRKNRNTPATYGSIRVEHAVPSSSNIPVCGTGEILFDFESRAMKLQVGVIALFPPNPSFLIGYRNPCIRLSVHQPWITPSWFSGKN